MTTSFKINYILSDFEVLSELSESQLVGGFSSAISIQVGAPLGVEDNNCSAGNCVSGCGSGQNLSKCNTVPGCLG
jgi:hypothetical protein